MNSTIISVAENTLNAKVRHYADMLIMGRNRKFVATFTKKNGEVRTMQFVPKHSYNDTVGIATCSTGRDIVRGKVAVDQIVVNEIYRDEHAVGHNESIRPRTINLRTIISLTPMPM